MRYWTSSEVTTLRGMFIDYCSLRGTLVIEFVLSCGVSYF